METKFLGLLNQENIVASISFFKTTKMKVEILCILEGYYQSKYLTEEAITDKA